MSRAGDVLKHCKLLLEYAGVDPERSTPDVAFRAMINVYESIPSANDPDRYTNETPLAQRASGVQHAAIGRDPEYITAIVSFIDYMVASENPASVYESFCTQWTRRVMVADAIALRNLSYIAARSALKKIDRRDLGYDPNVYAPIDHDDSINNTKQLNASQGTLAKSNGMLHDIASAAFVDSYKSLRAGQNDHNKLFRTMRATAIDYVQHDSETRADYYGSRSDAASAERAYDRSVKHAEKFRKSDHYGTTPDRATASAINAGVDIVQQRAAITDQRAAKLRRDREARLGSIRASTLPLKKK